MVGLSTEPQHAQLQVLLSARNMRRGGSGGVQQPLGVAVIEALLSCALPILAGALEEEAEAAAAACGGSGSGSKAYSLRAATMMLA
jgi:hypothetical protein